MKLDEIARLVEQLSQVVAVATNPREPVDIEALRAKLLADQPVPTPGQVRALAAIERGDPINRRNRDLRVVSKLGYVCELQDRSLVLNRLGRAVLERYQNQLTPPRRTSKRADRQ